MDDDSLLEDCGRKMSEVNAEPLTLGMLVITAGNAAKSEMSPSIVSPMKAVENPTLPSLEDPTYCG